MALPSVWSAFLGVVAIRKFGSAPLPLAEHLTALDSFEGAALLRGAGARAGYAALERHYAPQIRPTFCGPATMAILLNALHGARATGPRRLRPFDQRNVFTPEVERLRARKRVARLGMPLAVFGDALAAHGVAVDVHYVSDRDVDAFRCLARDALATEGRYVAVNYHRPALGQEGEGHISPLAAYSDEADRFLVLDVARSKYPPVWVATEMIHEAMSRPGGGRASRGFVTVGH
ncbi:phytochelatin synthase family protein [Amaricoccus sp.]|uniref:phytochelatin synthase family protein n=1 Tax=Amaricoccus sp. TaxID=1872485 RepID=UPI001B57F303|nr:phytochelatin synthase family protein [Amaricoccus sp.]MBP7242771.1 phytochelatin synthase family protein [Amaricoccus sp.]